MEEYTEQQVDVLHEPDVFIPDTESEYEERLHGEIFNRNRMKFDYLNQPKELMFEERDDTDLLESLEHDEKEATGRVSNDYLRI
eukprot:CAMPEP_0116895356 /NCGR_PEP_ID=MMETSP0467-20121206/4899_1 /TAXON_ID=283647 /ORGANISM="Mesodinium pulex, Strain SPMC105" /LENGTH=83 /DNA_ID=CAMNT_0004566043 /DNA_START=929 /DNA_END=1180 /DNA_ORIENTATION=-